MPRRESRGSEVVTIYWRDIPAQVNGQSGRDRHQVLLSSKFQRAVDRAKRKAGIYTADEDIAQWRRDSRPISGDLAQEAQAAADAIDVEYSRDRLGLLAYYGGWEADVVTTDAIDREVLAALEELDEEDEDQNSAVQNEQENQ